MTMLVIVVAAAEDIVVGSAGKWDLFDLVPPIHFPMTVQLLGDRYDHAQLYLESCCNEPHSSSICYSREILQFLSTL